MQLVAGYRDAPVALSHRDAIADIAHEWPFINTMTGLEGIAIQRDVVQSQRRRGATRWPFQLLPAVVRTGRCSLRPRAGVRVPKSSAGAA